MPRTRTPQLAPPPPGMRRILKDGITHLAGSGYMTTQIPQISVNFGDDPRTPDEQYDLVPEVWIAEIGYSNHKPIPSRSGSAFIQLTRAGWAANRERIREAYANRIYDRGYTWEEFEATVEREFQELEANIAREIDKLRRKIEQLSTYVV